MTDDKLGIYFNIVFAYVKTVSADGNNIGKIKMNTKKLIEEASSLPVEERAIVIDSLLRSMNPPESNIDKQWASVAKDRMNQIRSGQTTSVAGEEVFAKIWSRFSK